MRVMQTSKRRGKGTIVRCTTKSNSIGKKRKLSGESQEGCSSSKEARRTVCINDLPQPILGQILQRLNPVERINAEIVCRRWKYIASKFGWGNQREISKSQLGEKLHPMKPLNNSHIEVFLKRSGNNLRVLDIGSFSHVNKEQITYSICSLFINVPYLQTLDLSGIHMTNSSLSKIGIRFPNLKNASFRNSFKNTKMERGLTSFLSSCQNLICLDLSENEILNGTSLEAAGDSLEELHISGCFRIKTEGIRAIRDKCKNLKRLYMDQIDTIAAHDLNGMFEGLTKLEYLKFCDCYGSEMNDGQNFYNIGHLINLTELNLRENLLINDRAIEAISSHCHLLLELDISQSHRGVTDAGLRHLARLPKLNTLKMGGQRHLSDDTLTEISHRGSLKHLSVNRCNQITNASIIDVIKYCKELDSLDVGGCVGVTQAIFNELNKSMQRRYKGQPNRNTADRKFKLTISRSGIQGNVPSEYSNWIQLINYYAEDSSAHNAMFLAAAHFINFPLALMG